MGNPEISGREFAAASIYKKRRLYDKTVGLYCGSMTFKTGAIQHLNQSYTGLLVFLLSPRERK